MSAAAAPKKKVFTAKEKTDAILTQQEGNSAFWKMAQENADNPKFEKMAMAYGTYGGQFAGEADEEKKKTEFVERGLRSWADLVEDAPAGEQGMGLIGKMLLAASFEVECVNVRGRTLIGHLVLPEDKTVLDEQKLVIQFAGMCKAAGASVMRSGSKESVTAGMTINE